MEWCNPLINYLRKPWGKFLGSDEVSFGPSDSLNNMSNDITEKDLNDNIPILVHKTNHFSLYPYPKSGFNTALGIMDFPVRYRGRPNISADGEVLFENAHIENAGED